MVLRSGDASIGELRRCCESEFDVCVCHPDDVFAELSSVFKV